ncbi:hypothetical protein M3Y94_00517400 [Aphelenchoides besseyi]|nr:hypothetical protein M3Y94_00517400 [Aphelenchoides besseyi]KAI6225993.1 Peptidylprolyl isomerase [Aphelenchoides besseyi]
MEVADSVDSQFSSRNVVSSGEPSLNGSIDEDQTLSDSEIQKRSQIENLANSAKGPSSEHLERECEKTRLSALKSEHTSDDDPEEEEKSEEDEWADLLGSGDLLKKILVEGNGTRPESGQIVTLETSEVENQTEKTEFVLGHGFVIDAWDLATSLMSIGETCLLKSRSRFTGTKNESNTKDDDFREFKLTLLSAKSGDEWNVTEHIDRAREHGNKRYNSGEFERAARLYDYGLSFFNTDEKTEDLSQQTIETVKYTLLSNKAACLIQLEQWDKVIEITNDVSNQNLSSLQVNKLIVSKLLLRRADAFMKKRNYEEAQKTIRKCLSYDSLNKHAKLLLERAKTFQKRDDQKLNATYKNMFKELGKNEKRDGRLRQLLKKPQMKWFMMVSLIVLIVAVTFHYLSPNLQ